MRTTVVIRMLSGCCPLVTLADDVFGISAVAMLRVAGDMLPDVEIIVLTVVMIDSEFVFRLAYLEEVLAGVWASATTCGAPSTGAEVNVCGLAVVLPSPSEEPSRCCSASFSCWTMTAFDSDHALHDCKPSYHV